MTRRQPPIGQVASETGPWASDTVAYTYSDRLRTKLDLQQPNGSDWIQTYGYDTADRMNGITSPAGTFNYTYNSGVGGTTAASSLIKKIALPNTAYITNTFDNNGRMLSTILYNSGGQDLDSYAYTYNVGNERTAVTRTGMITNAFTNTANFTYDAIGQVLTDEATEEGSISRQNELLRYGFDPAGNLLNRTNNALVQSFVVNSDNELTSNANGGTLTVMGTTTSTATNVTVNGTNAATYGDATFAATNMPLTTNYTATASDSLGRHATNAVTVNLATNVSFQYDGNGNLTNDGLRSFAYDDENQLIQVWVPSNWMSHYLYDGKMRRRVRQEFTWQDGSWVQSSAVYYVYDGNLVIQERDANNLPTTTYTHGKDLSGGLQGAGGIGGLLARTAGSYADAPLQGHSFYHCDGNGNITMLINSEQAIVARYLYDAFGNVLSKSGLLADANIYQFSSKEKDLNSELVYYLYRFYDPHLQRWPNRDPRGEKGFMVIAFPNWNAIPETSLGVNLYEMVDNTPVEKIDPFGLSGITTGKGKGHGTPCKVDCASAEAHCNAAAVIGCAIIVGGPIGVVCPPCGFWGGAACAAAGIEACHKLEQRCEADNKRNGFGGGD